VLSDAVVRLCGVRSGCATRERTRAAWGDVRAQTEEEVAPVLRTEDGQRVFDEHDVRFLLALEEIQYNLLRVRLTRLRRMAGEPINDREAHLLEHGHELDFGCCRAA
jgi:hypothetical protein